MQPSSLNAAVNIWRSGVATWFVIDNQRSDLYPGRNRSEVCEMECKEESVWFIGLPASPCCALLVMLSVRPTVNVSVHVYFT